MNGAALILLGAVLGVPIGWYFRTQYQRTLYHASLRIRRAMRGGSKRR